MTIFSVIVAVFAVATVVQILILNREMTRLKREVAKLRGVHPSMSGTAKLTRQTKNGLIDIDLHV